MKKSNIENMVSLFIIVFMAFVIVIVIQGLKVNDLNIEIANDKIYYEQMQSKYQDCQYKTLGDFKINDGYCRIRVNKDDNTDFLYDCVGNVSRDIRFIDDGFLNNNNSNWTIVIIGGEKRK